ncbi:MAG: thiamine pyrophosphokinase, partial [Pseudomonadota bacterium]
AVFHGMLRYPEKTVILIGEAEVMALVPPGRPLRLGLWPGALVSLFPLRPARGVASSGLAWPIEGLEMEVGSQIGTSNEAISGPVSLTFDRAGVLLMLERRALGSLVGALTGER